MLLLKTSMSNNWECLHYEMVKRNGMVQPVKLLMSQGLLIIKDIDSSTEYEFLCILIFWPFFSISDNPWNETQEKNSEWGVSECVLCYCSVIVIPEFYNVDTNSWLITIFSIISLGKTQVELVALCTSTNNTVLIPCSVPKMCALFILL